MEKILFATDFSECSNNAFKYALSTCKGTKAKLEIITVSSSIKSSSEAIQKKLDQLLQNNEAYILDNKIEYQSFIKKGQVVEEIEEHIKKTKPDLVIVGSRGEHEVKGSSNLIGDTTHKLIEVCKVPLIAIPSHIKFKPAQNIIFITNRFQKDYFAIIQLLKFAQVYDTKVIIAHIHDNQGAAEEQFKTFYTDLSELLNYENFEFKYFAEESYIDGINILIKEYDAEILSLVYQKKNFFERLFNPHYVSNLLVNDYIPLLTLPE